VYAKQDSLSVSYDVPVRSHFSRLMTIPGMISVLGQKSKNRAKALNQLEFLNANHRYHLFTEMLKSTRK